MKFLITGAYGFVGTNLCKYLVEKGHTCDALDIPSAKRNDVPYTATYTWEDLKDHSSPSPLLFTLSSYDVVVHLAGKAHDLKKVASEQSYFDINVGLTERIFEALRQVKKVGEGVGVGEGEGEQRTFIYFSSIKADPNGNAYGRSKFAAEEYLKTANTPLSSSLVRRSICEGGTSSLNLSILRPAMIHGPGNKGNLNLLVQVVKKGIPWPLAAFENKRSFTSIGNICAVVEALALRPLRATYTFPIADDAPVATNRLIELIAEAYGKKAKLWRVPKGLMCFAAKVGDLLHLPLNTERLEKLTEDSIVDNSLIKKTLGWKNMPIDSESGLRKTLASFVSDKV